MPALAQILVAVPVLERPHRAQALLESLADSLDGYGPRCRLLFLCSLGDGPEIAACRRACAGVSWATADVCPWPAMPGDWAKKLNYAISGSDEPFILCGADDLAFHQGWAGAALLCAELTGAGVIGTNDLHNPRVVRGQHSTHPLLTRSYTQLGGIDGGPVLHEGYSHQYVDDELVAVAKARRSWTFCDDALVEHLHPYFDGAPQDATYRRGQDPERTRADLVLHQRRRRLWA